METWSSPARQNLHKQLQKARKIVKKYDEDATDTVTVKSSTQVQLEVRFIEAQRRKRQGTRHRICAAARVVSTAVRAVCRSTDHQCSGFRQPALWPGYRQSHFPRPGSRCSGPGTGTKRRCTPIGRTEPDCPFRRQGQFPCRW